jgi:hypothetical protein
MPFQQGYLSHPIGKFSFTHDPAEDMHGRAERDIACGPGNPLVMKYGGKNSRSRTFIVLLPQPES